MTVDATTTKLAATPAEVTLRSSIPTATVHNHTTTPVGTTAVGRRHASRGQPPHAGPAQKRPRRRCDARDVEPLVVAAPPDCTEHQHAGNIDAQPPQSPPRTFLDH